MNDQRTNILAAMVCFVCTLLSAGNSYNLKRLEGANRNFKVTINNIPYVLRIGQNRETLNIDREQEIYFYRIGEQLGISPRIIAWHADEQMIIAEYIENHNTREKMHTPGMMQRVIALVKKLHAYHVDEISHAISTVFVRNDRIIASAEQLGILSDYDHALIQSWMTTRKSFETGYYDGIATGICHGDLYYKNILEDASGKLYLIDWEYAFYGYTIDDIGKLCMGNDYTDDEIMFIAQEYYGQYADKYFLKIKQNIFMRHFSMYLWCRIQAYNNPEKKPYYDTLAQKSVQKIEVFNALHTRKHNNLMPKINLEESDDIFFRNS